MIRTTLNISEIINAIEEYLAGSHTQNEIAEKLGVRRSNIKRWIANYKAYGASAFTQIHNQHYSPELKEAAVYEYLLGNSSLQEVCNKYKIKSDSILRDWIKKYNGHERLKPSGTGGYTIMTKGRKTTFDERIEIVQYCIAHDHNYAETAEKYKISYQQARNYTVKYEKNGIDALQDRRGCSKNADELSELEKLRAEIRLLRAEKERAEMEASFLKKLEEIERRRG